MCVFRDRDWLGCGRLRARIALGFGWASNAPRPAAVNDGPGLDHIAADTAI
jgi:hypothetical protein